MWRRRTEIPKSEDASTDEDDTQETEIFVRPPKGISEGNRSSVADDDVDRLLRLQRRQKTIEDLEAEKISRMVQKVSPRELKAKLDEEVMGQDAPKESLSLLVSMYLSWDPVKYPKQSPPNAVIVGPTGSGKTYSAEVASRQFGIPFHIIDSTTMVPAGAANGNPVEIIRQRISYSEKCIVFLDEFDKLAALKEDTYKDWKDNVQRSLLKFIEGDSEASTVCRPLFLVGGAFTGIDGADNTRLRSIEVRKLMQRAPKETVVSDDLINFGFIPELVARLPAIIRFESLSKPVLLQILEHPTNSPLRMWEQYFDGLNKELVFTAGFLEAVAQRSEMLNLGARGLHQVVFPALARRAYALTESSPNRIEIDESILDY